MIFIRADANEFIGTGHVMRCLSIAKALVKNGNDVLFVTADHNSDILIFQNGFSNVCLDSVWDDLNNEIDKLNCLINKYKPLLVLVDSYYVTEYYLKSLSNVTRTAYIDDFHKKNWNVDILINYNFYATMINYDFYNSTSTKLLLGTKYVPLRFEYMNCGEHFLRDSVSDVLVTVGGSDPIHITENIIKNLCPAYSSITFHFIVGALNSRLEKLKKIVKNTNNIILHINENRLSDLMKKCDIAISAAGTTLYELCACGIPTITFSLADNQILLSSQFCKYGIMLSAGDCRNDDKFFNRLGTLLNQLISDKKKRFILSHEMQKLVDGNGSIRLSNEIII